MLDTLPPLGLQRVKVIALAVTDLHRANQFYGQQLGLPPAFEGEEPVGWWLDSVILMLKPDGAAPTHRPNPRITLATEHAPATQDALRARGIVIADEVQPYGAFYVGQLSRQRRQQTVVLFAGRRLSEKGGVWSCLALRD